MKKKKIRVAIRSWAALVFTAALLLSTLYSNRIHAEDVTPEDRQAFKEALEDTATATQAEICRDLLAVVPGPDSINYERLNGGQIKWQDENAPGHSPVQVVAFMTMASYNDNYAVKMNKPGTLTKSIWVTVVPELKNFFIGEACPPTRERLRQVLGLNPAYAYEVLVELWVDATALFRPTPDPEITDHEGELSTKIKTGHWTFPSERSPFLMIDNNALFLEGAWLNTKTFKEWFIETADISYSTEGKDIADWRNPWTRLGYTYDWGNKDNHVGLSEFMIRIDPYDGNLWVQYGEAIIYGTASWDDYFRCGPAAPTLSATTSTTGVSLAWTNAAGAEGYYLKYKAAQRGKPFEPPFENYVDLGNSSGIEIPLDSGSCFYAAVQSYDLRGEGGLSNIVYIYFP